MVKATNPIFNHLKSHNEIFLGSSSTIQPFLDEYPLIPVYLFNFKTIKEIQTIPKNFLIDLVGLVILVSPTSTIRKHDGVETVRRTIGLCNMSSYSIDITLWGENCQIQGDELSSLRGLPTPPTVEITSGCVTDCNGKIVGTISNTTIFINPNIEKISVLQKWFHDNGFHSASPSLSQKFNASHSASRKIITINQLQTLHSQQENPQHIYHNAKCLQLCGKYFSCIVYHQQKEGTQGNENHPC